MIEKLSVKNFKSWADLPALEFGKVTALFGANSSGKTSLIQLLLMLKQTAASRDRRILNFGGTERDYVDLGGYHDLVHGHRLDSDISFDLTWTPNGFYWDAPWEIDRITLGVTFSYIEEQVAIKRIAYSAEMYFVKEDEDNRIEEGSLNISVSRQPNGQYGVSFPLVTTAPSDELRPEGFYEVPLPIPVDFTNLEQTMYHEQARTGLSRALEKCLGSIYYLGPLREYPHRDYRWSGEKPSGVGVRGEQAVQAMLSKLVSEQSNELVDSANEWLRRLGMADRVELRPVAKGTRLYEFVVQTRGYKHEANIMDVGFGVSQVLPIIVLAHFAPPGSLLILEQPEIHLHPQVQTDLADLFLEAALERNVQFLIESHSEYLLMRLQRRLAERKEQFAKLSENDVKLYFCKREAEASVLEPLEIDEFGRIKNWPQDFFGDAVAERRAMTDAMLERQLGK